MSQVIVSPLLPGLVLDAVEAVEVAHCTQIPVTNAVTSLKRLRKQGQCSASVEGVETTPKPRTRSRSKMVETAGCSLAELTLQTPMPASMAGNEFSPPPPITTPTPHRGNVPIISSIFREQMWSTTCPRCRG